MQKLSLVYFSPTGNTQTYLRAMAEIENFAVESIDITSTEPAPRTFSKDDFVIFGAPVHGGRIPTQASRRLNAFKGQKTPCLLVACYGNRHYDDALMELNQITTQSGFVPQGAAALVARHTYGDIQKERPDQDDINAARNFLETILAKINREKKLKVPGNYPYKAKVFKGPFKPKTNTETCVKCGMCVRECPMSAIAEDCVTVSKDCIGCMRCVRNCPTHSKVCDSLAFVAISKLLTFLLRKRRENEFFS